MILKPSLKIKFCSRWDGGRGEEGRGEWTVTKSSVSFGPIGKKGLVKKCFRVREHIPVSKFSNTLNLAMTTSPVKGKGLVYVPYFAGMETMSLE